MAAEPFEVAVQITPRAERPTFPSYVQLPVRVPLVAWRAARVVTLLAAFGLCVVLLTEPATGLRLVWRLLVPALPLMWFVLPGLWRNLCPLAAGNQVPRVLGFSRELKVPGTMARFSYQFAMVAFLLLVPARKVLFNRSATATAVLLLVVLGTAFVGGVLFRGKSGWCSTFCPLLPVQRLYGETPFLLVRNSHCEPCVGCAKNCYDFNPRVAEMADLSDDDPGHAGPRRFFAACLPGLVLGFFSMPDVPAHSTAWVYGRIALFIAASVATYAFAEAFVVRSEHRLTAVWAATAINAFYWYSVPTLVSTIGASPVGDVRSVAIWSGRLVVLALSLLWLQRTFAKEAPFLAAASEGVPVVAAAARSALRGRGADDPSVTFEPDGPEVAVPTGTPLLDVIEAANLTIEAGCRMGVCGADPVAITTGGGALTPVGAEEASTLGRLGLAGSTRLACQARVLGSCTVSLVPDRAARTAVPAGSAVADPSVGRVVIVGNGVAGATAADHARRLHGGCEIHLVSMEPHRLYNRMAISRLIHGRSAMQGLYLLPDSWYDDHGITCWLNTRARAIDLTGRTVTLATGESLPYDRLVLTTGSRSVVPDIDGIGLPGSFTLRRAEDAIAMRAYVQDHDVRSAVVTGGGPLGLESAYGLHKLGVGTTVVHRGTRLMGRCLDEPAAQVLQRYLEALGITIVTEATPRAVRGVDHVEGVELADGRTLDCGLLLACPGVVPEVDLARAAGLVVDRGIVVDRRMRTSDPAVFAAGEAAQIDGVVAGLWPPSARQGEVAGVNAVGGAVEYTPTIAMTVLKGIGLDVASIGRWEAASPDDVVVVLADEEGARYRKLVLSDGRPVGAILVGHGGDAPAVQRAVDEGRDVTDVLDRLRAGDWAVLDPEGLSRLAGEGASGGA
jgi:nitrite reductase (NADH) large subunit